MIISKQEARKFLLTKQLLFPPQSLSGFDAVEKVFQHLRLIQYDPLNPCGRNQDLVLQARISDYHQGGYFKWLYQEKRGIECYDKELCILPIEDFSLSRIRQGQMKKRQDKKRFLKRYQKEIEKLFSQINQNGPITASDIESPIKVKSGWGSDARFGSQALEVLWKTGRLAVVKREKMKKYYDLPNRVHKSLSLEDPGSHILSKQHVIRRLKSVGMLPASGRGGGWQGLGSVLEVGKIIRELVKDKIILEVSIIDGNTYVILSEDGQLFKQKANDAKKIVFIAPLDNLMWDREMTYDLFDFHYRWEVYTPILKRKFGYYVLPILYGDEFIGRIEPIFKEGILEIKGLWKENRWDSKTNNAYQDAIYRFGKYLNAKKIQGV